MAFGLGSHFSLLKIQKTWVNDIYRKKLERITESRSLTTKICLRTTTPSAMDSDEEAEQFPPQYLTSSETTGPVLRHSKEDVAKLKQGLFDALRDLRSQNNVRSSNSTKREWSINMLPNATRTIVLTVCRNYTKFLLGPHPGVFAGEHIMRIMNALWPSRARARSLVGVPTHRYINT